MSCYCNGVQIAEETVFRCIPNATAAIDETKHHQSQLEALYFTLAIIFIYLFITTSIMVINTRSAHRERERIIHDLTKQRSIIRNQERLIQQQKYCYQLIAMGHVRPSILEGLDLAGGTKRSYPYGWTCCGTYVVGSGSSFSVGSQ